MRRGLLLVAIFVVAGVIGFGVGWRWVLAPLLAVVLLKWSLASLRVLYTDARHGAGEAAPAPVADNERTLFWCEECGTEVLLVVRGTARGPSHCGQRMNERTELLG